MAIRWQRQFLTVISVAAVVAFVPPALADQLIDFNRDIRPLLSNKCFACHGPDASKREAGLRLDDAKIATGKLESGAVAIVSRNPDASELIRRVTSSDDERMPPATFGKPLSTGEIATLRKWIEQGARFATHWSYTVPVRPALPSVPDDWRSWPKNEIDRFALQSMLAHGLRPAAEEERYGLIRRVYLDLIGLPPTVEEANAFATSRDPQAYEKIVDDLLSRSSYGEHWARMWLDLARYADSAGYADDPPRTIWAYRDWVIRAINDNKPFDQFTIDQLAGDLLPEPSEDQLIATAFHRNTLTNSEGGTQDEEFRNSAVVDRVNTTMAVWMGTTVACAQCHNHKFDPISQREYFQLFAILNNTADADLKSETPLLLLYTGKQRRDAIQSAACIAELQAVLATTVYGFAQSAILAAEADADLRRPDPETSVPICRELGDGEQRVTHLEYRGNYLDKGPVVEPGLPSAFNVSTDAGRLDRLKLARWLVDKSNPLTARVIANRYWEILFGRGIVLTSEDFGSQGEPPTHPELLDLLATEFMHNGWNTKALLRLIVTSATYRQSSQIVGNAVKTDPDNRWLARGPRVRLSAETLRDQALAVSGLLSKKMYGPPVRPPQPTMGLNAAFGSSTDWQTSEGEDRYRRAIYVTWRRSNPYPSMATFDAPNREVCALRRTRTNTPLQSLVTLNDPVYVEAAQALARRAIEHDSVVEEQIAFAFRCCLLRPPRDVELNRLLALYRDSHAHLATRAKAAEQLATVPHGKLPSPISTIDAAAMTVVSNVLLNLDEMVLKR